MDQSKIKAENAVNSQQVLQHLQRKNRLKFQLDGFLSELGKVWNKVLKLQRKGKEQGEQRGLRMTGAETKKKDE